MKVSFFCQLHKVKQCVEKPFALETNLLTQCNKKDKFAGIKYQFRARMTAEIISQHKKIPKTAKAQSSHKKSNQIEFETKPGAKGRKQIKKTLSLFGNDHSYIKLFSNCLKLTQTMFTQTLNSRLLSSSKSLKNLINPQQPKSLDLADLQFLLCSNFLKLTKQKLYHQQAELLSLNKSLINKFSERAMLASSASLKDESASQDTTTFSFQGQEDEDLFIQSCKSMLILRKSKSTTCMRRTESDFSSVLRQVQRKCSERTSQTISSLIEQNKKLKEKNSKTEKKEKQFKKKHIEYEKEQEQMFMLKKKASEHDKVINSMHAEIAALKLRLKENESCLKRSKSPTDDLSPVNQSQHTAKVFLQQKQLIISQSTKQLKLLYAEVESKIQEPFVREACDKCCQMLKKIKGSIMKYRELMETEANAVEGLYEKFKAKLK